MLVEPDIIQRISAMAASESGLMPGAVIYTDYKTMLVTPDEKLVSELKKS